MFGSKSPDTVNGGKVSKPFRKNILNIVLILIAAVLGYYTFFGPTDSPQEQLKKASTPRYAPALPTVQAPAPTALTEEVFPAEGVPYEAMETWSSEQPVVAQENYTTYEPMPPRRTSNSFMAEMNQIHRQSFRSSAAVSGWGNPALRGSLSQPQAEPRTPVTAEEYQSPTSSVLAAAQAAGLFGGSPRSSEEREAWFSKGGEGDRGYHTNLRHDAPSPYVLPAGTMIPCILISGINSDLPGNLSAQVSENVYDWVNHRAVLIPQGSRLFGRYNSRVEFGQRRVQFAWHRVVFPDGSALSLDGMPGMDRRGYSGIKGKYDAHYGRMFFAALMTASIGAIDGLFNKNDSTVVYNNTGTVVTVPGKEGSTVAANNEFSKNAAQALGEGAKKHLNRVMDVPPTIVVRPGTRFAIQTTADIPFFRAWRKI